MAACSIGTGQMNHQGMDDPYAIILLVRVGVDIPLWECAPYATRAISYHSYQQGFDRFAVRREQTIMPYDCHRPGMTNTIAFSYVTHYLGSSFFASLARLSLVTLNVMYLSRKSYIIAD